jgi:hypothetical protein
MATAYDTANIVISKSAGYKSGVLQAWNPKTSSLVDFAVTRAGATATRVNEAGLIESVAANVPRIDWAEGGSCPSLLVEPQRTNLQFPSSNDNTNYIEVNSTFTASSGTSPDGTSNAALIAETTANNNHYYGNLTGVSVVNASTYVLSVFLKKGAGATAPDIIQLTFNFAGFGSQYSNFNINTGTITATSGSTAKIDAYPNGWYKCSHIVTATSTANTGGILAFTNNNGTATRLPSYVGLTTSNVLYYGFDVQQGSYPTSHIPTAGTTETRNADVISLSSASALLNDSAGTRYLEATVFDDSVSNVIEISDATDPTLNAVLFDINGTAIKGECIAAGVSTSITGAAATAGTYNKLAFGYEVNNFGLHIDGSTSGTDVSGAIPSGLDQIRFTDGTNAFYGRIRVMAEYPYKMTSTESNNLTT